MLLSADVEDDSADSQERGLQPQPLQLMKALQRVQQLQGKTELHLDDLQLESLEALLEVQVESWHSSRLWEVALRSSSALPKQLTLLSLRGNPWPHGSRCLRCRGGGEGVEARGDPA
ncbi:unnamed protein product [Durusdinium trenchii]|uniref:Uncharacterized protein n=1 Tax=Durusdinium trenchii TaxID=1381693 RepID=A0ABP0RJT6_9DINO